MRTFQPRGASIALFIAIAVAFFFAGYSARAIRAEAAQTPIPIATPPPPDGNPVGHIMNPPQNLEMAPPPSGLAQHLRFLSQHPITIVYQLAWPKNSPYRKRPTCNGMRPPCYPFVWKNMTIQTLNYNGTDNKRTTVDVYGTLSK